MWNSFLLVCRGKPKLRKNSAIHNKTFAIERRMFSFSPPWSWPTLSISKCLQYVKFNLVRILPEAKIMKKITNTQSNICKRMYEVSLISYLSLTYIFHFGCLKYVKFVQFQIDKIVIQNQTFTIHRLKSSFYQQWPWPKFSI